MYSVSDCFSRFWSPDPAGETAGRHDRDQVLDGRSERFAELDQPLSFPRRADDPFGQFVTKDPVLLLKIFNVAGQLGLGGAGQDHEQGVEKLSHADITVSRLKD